MEQIKDKFLTVILIIIILGAIAGFAYVGYKYMTEEPETNSNIAVVEEQINSNISENQVVENISVDESSSGRKIEVVKKEEKTVTVENTGEGNNSTTIAPPETTDIYNIRKYHEDGFIKTETNGFSPKSTEYKLRYNYDYRGYDLEFIVPSNWIPGHYVLTDEVQYVQATEKVEGGQPMQAIITEMEIEPGTSYNDALGLLANKISEFVSGQGNIYETVNWGNEEIEIDGEMYRVLTYQHNAGKYYQTQCYTVIKLRDPFMYILTVAVPTNKISDENIELKNKIFKSFKFVD